MIYLNEIEGLEKRELFPLEPIDEGSSKFNPSLCLYRGNIYYTLRKCNYTRNYTELVHSPSVCDESECFKSTFILFKGDEKLFEVSSEVLEPNGIEDARLFVFNDELYVSCSKLTQERTIPIVVYKINLDKRRLEYVCQYGEYMEKNWMNIPETLDFVRWPGYERYGFTTGVITYGKPQTSLRGSTRLLNYKNGYIGICHTSSWHYIPIVNNFGLVYFHYFVLFDKDLNITKKVPFRITRDIPVEFIPGLEYVDSNFFITYSLMDSENYEIRISEEILSSLVD